MKIDILTLFPEMFKGPFEESIIKRAQEKKLVQIKLHNLRKWGLGVHKTLDDRPFGGGVGMVLMVEPIYKALKELNNQTTKELKNKKTKKPSYPKHDRVLFKKDFASTKVVLLTPQGKVFNQKTARRLAKQEHLILICGHYEGVDERVRKHLVDEEISIGDYILTGGELPAIVLTDAIVRLLPGVLEKPEATKSESFSRFYVLKHRNKGGLLEYPQYTRPADFKGWKAPEVLLSGNHQKIEEWRKKQSLRRTQSRRPDLFKK